jgi:hypothetical protein
MSKSPTYVVLAECNGKEYETWYTFIKYEGNENALNHLQSQLEKVDFYILNDLSTFELDLDHRMSENTAKEMIRLEINSKMFHRMFMGKLKPVEFGFHRNDSNKKKIVKVFEKLGIGKIEEYLSEEYIDPNQEYEENNSTTDYEYDETSESDS